MVYKENINVKPYAPPEKDYIKKESEKILKVVKSFCDIAKIESDRIKYNSPTIKDIVIRMDMRQLYFKIYHDNMSINEYKCNTGLLIFWILKLHPFWIDVESNDSQQIINIATNINEQISLHLRNITQFFWKEEKIYCRITVMNCFIHFDIEI